MQVTIQIVTGLLILLCVTDGCIKAKPLTVSVVSGVYVVKYSHGTETLELRNDGIFTQRYICPAQEQPIVNQGKWALDVVSEEVDLFDALIFDTGKNEPRNPPLKTRWLLKIIQGSGHIRISIDPD